MYQLIILGNSNIFHDLMLEVLFKRVRELGVSEELLNVIYPSDFKYSYRANNPAIGIYYGGTQELDIDIIERLNDDASIILPVFNEVSSFYAEVPELLHQINGILLESKLNIDALVNNILEGFNLLRISRRLFISYKRSESRGVAIQLFEKLEQAGFDVFLDTHSIRKGDMFQEELWHRLVDADVVVLLNTPGFLDSEWTTEELAKANSMSIGILQLIWPNNIPERPAELSIPVRLKKRNFIYKRYDRISDVLTDEKIRNIINQVESLRARSLSARQNNIINEFLKSAKFHNKVSYLQREKFLTVVGNDNKVIVVIPTIGVPHAFSYQQSDQILKFIDSTDIDKVYLLYDHRNIREKWLQHLTWLDKYLPIRTIKITEIDNWIRSI